MSIYISDTWSWFCIGVGIVLLASFIMLLQGRNFFTMDVVERKFTILDLQFAGKQTELMNLIKGIYLLPNTNKESINRGAKVVKALKSQLIVNLLLFMPATYGSIFLLCMKVATKMGPIGEGLFSILAWIQVAAFIFDAAENIYLLQKIRREPHLSSRSVYRAYQFTVISKWTIVLSATVCAFSAIFYFWVSGLYSNISYRYILIVCAEIVLFVVAGFIVSKSQRKPGVKK